MHSCLPLLIAFSYNIQYCTHLYIHLNLFQTAFEDSHDNLEELFHNDNANQRELVSTDFGYPITLTMVTYDIPTISELSVSWTGWDKELMGMLEDEQHKSVSCFC